ncbi:hypothetical protein KSD_00810 [Ktedonobacter sp. SOSP1-85]|uniref:hypothetical protein n=1 Tax=Ktedonobacter sp. SOSP1-85 TaxID=2778367 RepID=UPI0019152727|nr:hypothetical protein [Ktedonobacter sp. SOSP1-85]GHO72310.1 hypothetical protein KSD_00810 [Ktedonobacter sp. SOSP1-85]
MRQSEQGRAWFGRALHDFLWLDEMNDFLEEMEGGWLNGVVDKRKGDQMAPNEKKRGP